MRIHILVTDEKGDTYEGTAELQPRKNKSKQAPKQNLDTATKSTRAGPSGPIRELYLQNFFKTEKKRRDVIEALGKMGHNYQDQAVSMALSRADYLVKKGPEKDYSFVQKYPPS